MLILCFRAIELGCAGGAANEEITLVDGGSDDVTSIDFEGGRYAEGPRAEGVLNEVDVIDATGTEIGKCQRCDVACQCCGDGIAISEIKGN